ncbi:MAG: GNAT family N-acetyltransferase [Arcobacter sp.]|nr:GNAT family N-acetyltransferase [Arcobacter sp.]
MNKFYILNQNDKLWSKFIMKSKQYDFYHTSCYHGIEQKFAPILFVASFDDDFIAFPFLSRRINDTNYFDFTSVYGYCGPISNKSFENVSKEHITYFQNQFNTYLNENCIVSVFSSLHPIINGIQLFNNFGKVEDINKTVAIDLSICPDEQRKLYRKSNRSEINQLRRKGFDVLVATTDEDIEDFIKIYYDTMIRVNAKQDYFFNKNYFFQFLKNRCFETKLLLARKDNQISAGAIFTITNKIMQYHLAGTKEEFIKDAPMKLIIDEARLIGNELKLDYLHLGGGVGGSDEDPLFRFKSGFSSSRFMYRTWHYIVNQEIYNELVNLSGARLNENGNYFPLYRLS